MVLAKLSQGKSGINSAVVQESASNSQDATIIAVAIPIGVGARGARTAPSPAWGARRTTSSAAGCVGDGVDDLLLGAAIGKHSREFCLSAAPGIAPVAAVNSLAVGALGNLETGDGVRTDSTGAGMKAFCSVSPGVPLAAENVRLIYLGAGAGPARNSRTIDLRFCRGRCEYYCYTRQDAQAKSKN